MMGMNLPSITPLKSVLRSALSTIIKDIPHEALYSCRCWPWFYPEITDTSLRVDNPHLEVKNAKKTIFSDDLRPVLVACLMPHSLVVTMSQQHSLSKCSYLDP